MHTYMKDGDNGDYHIGMWLMNSGTGRVEFWKMFDVNKRHEAIRTVNILNGGNGDLNSLPPPIKEY